MTPTFIQEDLSVEYSEHMGSDLTVVNAARQSFNKQKDIFDEADANLIQFLATGLRTKEWNQLLNSFREVASTGSDEDLKRMLLNYKNKAQHWAPFGHPHVTLRLRFPIFLARQFVKHQVGGIWSEESRRYMSTEPSFYIEPILHGRPDDIKQGAEGVIDNPDIYDVMNEVTQYSRDQYMSLIDAKVAPEEAREILTLNMMTGITWTGSLLFWARVCQQRVDPHAQSAAQKLGKLISQIMDELYPESWNALVTHERI